MPGKEAGAGRSCYSCLSRLEGAKHVAAQLRSATSAVYHLPITKGMLTHFHFYTAGCEQAPETAAAAGAPAMPEQPAVALGTPFASKVRRWQVLFWPPGRRCTLFVPDTRH